MNLRKVLLYIVSIPILLALGLVGLAFVFEDKIKEQVIAEVNKSITAEVKVNGKITFSFIEHFPYGSLTFNQVTINDKLRVGKKLMEVEEFSFLFNLLSLLRNKAEVSKILFRTGELNLYVDAKGNANYNILKPDTAKGEKNKFGLRLKNAEIKNVVFTYLNEQQGGDIKALVDKIRLSGNFSADEFDLDAKGQFQVHHINFGGEHYLSDKKVECALVMHVNKVTNQFEFSKGDLAVAGNKFNIIGFFRTTKRGIQLRFEAKNEGKDLQKLLQLLPAGVRKQLEDADGNGAYTIQAKLNGLISKNSRPNFTINGSLAKSEIKLKHFQKALENVSAKVYYQYDSTGNDRLVIENFNSTIKGQPFSFQLKLAHLSNPDFDFKANGVLDIKEIASLIPDSVLKGLEGTVSFKDFQLKGSKKDFTDVANSNLAGSGEFILKDGQFVANDISYGNINGTLDYRGKYMEAKDITINFLGTDFNFNGKLGNLIPYVYALSKRVQDNPITLEALGKVKVKSFNLTQIIEAYSKKNRPKAELKKAIDIREVLNMEGGLQVEVEDFHYQKLLFENLKADLELSPGQINIKALSANAMAGQINVVGHLLFTPDKVMDINCSTNLVGLELAKLFEQTENFGQQTLTDKNLKGNITANLQFHTIWKNYKELDKDQLTAFVDFRLTNGELIDFEPIKAASKFIRVEELRRIRFQDIANQLDVRNKRITIPEMEIKSSALNLMLSGFHNFDNTIEYHFKVNLHKVLASKFNRNPDGDAYVEHDPYEGINLFLTMFGDLTHPKFRYDKSAVKNKVKLDLKKQKEELHDLFSNKPKKVDENENKREEKYFDLRQDSHYMDFDTTK